MERTQGSLVPNETCPAQECHEAVVWALEAVEQQLGRKCELVRCWTTRQGRKPVTVLIYNGAPIAAGGLVQRQQRLAVFIDGKLNSDVILEVWHG